MKKRSILLRTVVIQFLVFLVAVAISNILGVREALRTQTGSFDTLQATVARGMATMAERNLVNPELLRANARLLEQTYQETSQIPDVTVEAFNPVMEIWTARGELLYRTPENPPLGVAPSLNGFAEVRYRSGVWHAYGVASKSGSVRVVLAESLDRRKSSLTPRWQDVVINLVVLFLIFFATAWVSLRVGLRPLRKLAAEIAARTPQDLQALTLGLGYSETAPLAAALNGMMARVAASQKREQAFLADAAHELRTPIAAIQAQLHALLHARNEVERAEIGQDIQQGLDRAASLARQLIALARVQSEGYVVQTQGVDLVELVRDRIAAYVPLARGRGMTLAYLGVEQAEVLADPAALAAVVDNLLDNAIKYGRERGMVELDIRFESRHVLLRVRDDGPGVAPAHRARLFERFFRVPESNASGSGLGLAIVRSLVERHHGTVTWIAGLNGAGIGFELRLPAA